MRTHARVCKLVCALAMMASASSFGGIIPLGNPGFDDSQTSILPWTGTTQFSHFGLNRTTSYGVGNEAFSNQGYDAYTSCTIETQNGQCMQGTLYARTLLQQTVTLDSPQTGAFTFSAWIQLSTYCGVPSGWGRVGIDTTGGTNPNAATVVWSAYTDPLSVHNRVVVTAPTATTNKITVFINAYSSTQLDSCRDGAVLAEAQLAIDEAILTSEPHAPPTITIQSPSPLEPVIGRFYLRCHVAMNDSTNLLKVQFASPGGQKTWTNCPPGDFQAGPYRQPPIQSTFGVTAWDYFGNVVHAEAHYEVLTAWPTVQFEPPSGWNTWPYRIIADPAGNMYLFGDKGQPGVSRGMVIKVSHDLEQQWLCEWDSGLGPVPDRTSPCIVDADGYAMCTNGSQSADYGIRAACVRPDGTPAYNLVWSNAPDTALLYPMGAVSDGNHGMYVVCVAEGGEPYDRADIFHIDINGSVTPLTYRGPDALGVVPYAIGLDPGGSIYIAGAAPSGNSPMLLVAKLAPDGDVIWEASHTYQPHGCAVYYLALDGAGNAYVSGDAMGAGYIRGHLTAKFDPDGHECWSDVLSIPGRSDYVGGIAIAPSGMIYMTECIDTVPYSGGFVSGLVKYTPDGARLWNKVYEDRAANETFPLNLDANESIYWLNRTLDDLGTDTLCGAVSSVDKDGNVRWHAYIEDAHYTLGPMDMVVDPAGNSFVAAFVDTLPKASIVRVPATGVSIAGHVELGTFGGDSTGIPIDLRVRRGGQVLDTQSGALTGLGNYVLWPNATGVVDLTAKPSHWLSTPHSGAMLNGISYLDWTFDVNGDAWEDDHVNLADLSTVLSVFDSTDPAGDLDGNGSVDLLDLSIVLANFNLSGVW